MQLTHFADILGLGTPELILIVVIILIIFGGSQLPKLAKSIGGSVKELRKGFEDDKSKSKSKTDDK